ncbi:ATP-binding protein [Streptomyces bobili]|uniref:ATP-binding protein n=1 Tax=Streptomyces bobili TaxID=67280 RepID=UPI0033F3B145
MPPCAPTALTSSRTAGSRRVYSCRPPHDDRAPAVVRGWIAGLLGASRARSLGEDLALVATELVTNAVRHGAVPTRVSLSLTDGSHGGRVRLEVEDGGAGFASDKVRPADADSSACGGRGLHIVAALACDWGNAKAAGRHVVWAELAADGVEG